jgi:hypothetical protein
VVSRKKILKIIDDFKIYVNSMKRPELIQEFEETMVLIGVFKILILVAYFGCAVLIFLYPFAVYLLLGEWILHFGFEIPGLNRTTMHGYVINFAYHSYQIFVVICGMISTNYVNIVFSLAFKGMYDGLNITLKNLKDEMAKDDNISRNQKIHENINGIIVAYVELRRFLLYIL